MNLNADDASILPVRHESGRFQLPPESIEQAKARVIDQLEHVKSNFAIGMDVGYACSWLDEAVQDYIDKCWELVQ